MINKGKISDNELPSTFVDEEGKVYENADACAEFNNFFSNIGAQLEMNIPPSAISPLEYLTPTENNDLDISLKTNNTEVASIIKTLNPVGGGFDKISTEILLLTYKSILSHLTFFFNLCLQTASFPDKLKIAIIKPIHKAGDKNAFNNYRPISLLPVFSKILEKILHSYLLTYINEQSIINPLQFGFRRNHSTYMPIARIIDKITSSLEQRQATCLLYLDLKKAFDTVSLNILLEKLNFIGVKGKLFAILKSYLTNRKQRTQFNTYLSKESVVNMGVPQGSILGTLLFILYINDISNISKEVSFYLFADDTAIMINGKNMLDLQNIVCEVLPKITNWFRANRLSLNTTKTFYQLFSNTVTDNLDIFIDNCQIHRKESVKYLGVTIQENLKWNEHIIQVSKSVSRGIGMIARAKH